MPIPTRPKQATAIAALLLAAGAFTLWLGTMATAYYVPGAVLIGAAVLLWTGRAGAVLKALLLGNQLSAILMLLMLLTPIAAWLHLPKLEIAGVMLLLHLATGGPLMSVLSIPLLGSMHFSRTLPDWFARRTASAAAGFAPRAGAAAR